MPGRLHRSPAGEKSSFEIRTRACVVMRGTNYVTCASTAKIDGAAEAICATTTSVYGTWCCQLILVLFFVSGLCST